MFEGDVLAWDSGLGTFACDPGPEWPEHIVLGAFGREDRGKGCGVWAVYSGDFDTSTGWSEHGAYLACVLPRPATGFMKFHVDSTSPCGLSVNKTVPLSSPDVPVPELHEVHVYVPPLSLMRLITIEGADMQDIPNIVFLVTGQSNSIGTGGRYEASKDEDQPVAGIMGWNHHIGKWTQARLDDWSLGYKPPGYQCAGFHFARYLKRRYPRAVVGVVVVGEGGQSISRWSKAIGLGDIYDISVGVTRQALSASWAGSVSGVLWSQGQADYAMDGRAYGACLRGVIDQYRSNDEFRSSPFIACELPGKKYAEGDEQTDALRDLDRDADDKTISVKSANLPTSDPWHFSTSSHRELGRRYLMAWGRIIRGNRTPGLW